MAGASHGGRRLSAGIGISLAGEDGVLVPRGSGFESRGEDNPLVLPSDDDATLAAATALASNSDGGLAMRVLVSELHLISDLLERTDRPPGSIDLIVDFGVVSDVDGRYAAAIASSHRLDRWRGLIFLGGAFPKDLSALEVGQHVFRYDWPAWKEMAESSSRSTSAVWRQHDPVCHLL